MATTRTLTEPYIRSILGHRVSAIDPPGIDTPGEWVCWHDGVGSPVWTREDVLALRDRLYEQAG